MSFISDGIHREYEAPEEHVPYDSSEGGWQLFTPQEGSDLIEELGFDECPEELHDDISQAFLHTQWVQKHPFSLARSDALCFTWESFCEQIKHHTRFVFYRTNSETASVEGLGHAEPHEILETIGELVTRFGLLTGLEASTRIVRGRQHKRAEKFNTAVGLGPPPREVAAQSRMSPGGIPMFYGADSHKTAFAETFDPNARSKRSMTFGTFRTGRTLKLLDLTGLPPIPSLFDEGRYPDRMSLIFLHEFTDDIMKPVARAGSEHYEYVSTQVVAEYFRRVFEFDNGKSIDGIKFKSSRYEKGMLQPVLHSG